MTPFLSAYIDGVRVLAALSVLVGHWGANLDHKWAAAGWHHHDSVIVFFVLSGFVISHAAQRTTSIQEFIFDRATRIYSVALPALALAIAVGSFGDQYPAGTEVNSPRSIFLHLTFLNWSWLIALRATNIGPWWSLTYEVWYYALFAASLYCSGWRRTGLIVLMCLFAGPKVLLLAPAWWCGVLAHRHWQKIKFPVFLVVTPLLLFIVLKANGGKEIFSFAELLGPYWANFKVRLHILGWSAWFPWDYLVAVLTALHLCGIAKLTELQLSPKWAKTIKWCAGATFSLYLTHLVFIRFFDYYLGWSTYLTLFATIIAALIFAELFERPLRFWRELLRKGTIRGLRTDPGH